MKSFWFQLNDDIITDAIDYEYEGYTQVVIEQSHLPAGINGGWFRWDGSAYHFDQVLFDAAMAENNA